MSQTPTTKELENAKKFPWQRTTLLLCGVIGTLFGLYVLSRNKGDENCDERISVLQKVAARKDSVIFDWQTKYINMTNELLYKNNIIDRQQQVIDNTDSVARKRLEKPAKQIVKSNE